MRSAGVACELRLLDAIELLSEGLRLRFLGVCDLSFLVEVYGQVLHDFTDFFTQITRIDVGRRKLFRCGLGPGLIRRFYQPEPGWLNVLRLTQTEAACKLVCWLLLQLLRLLLALVLVLVEGQSVLQSLDLQLILRLAFLPFLNLLAIDVEQIFSLLERHVLIPQHKLQLLDFILQ